MKTLKIFLALPLALLLTGCAPVDSLNPLYSSKDAIFDPTLLGDWGNAGAGLSFAKQGDGYRLVVSAKDDDITVAFDAHLVELQGHRFLDITWKQSEPREGAQALSEVQVTHTKSGLEIEPRLVSLGEGSYLELVPGESAADQDRFSLRLRQAHEFFKVVIEDEGRTLKLVQLDDSWIDDQIRDGKLVIDHETMPDKSAVLTASTPELQQLVLDHVDDDDAWRGETVLERPGAEIVK